MADELDIPMLSDIDTVRLGITCESVLDTRRGEDAEDYARTALKHYAAKIADVVGWEHVNMGEEVEESEYDSDMPGFHMSCHVDVTPEQWLQIADAYCMDLQWVTVEDEDGHKRGVKLDDMSKIPAVPEDYVPTMGMLGADGITPAVAIEGTDEGWGDYSGEPILCASFYVALLLKSDEDN